MNLFVYGTLLVPKIWEAVSGIDDATGVASSISGYQIYRVQGGDFPGIVATGKNKDRVSGRIFCDLPERALRRLDAYEDTFYERHKVDVLLADKKSMGAYAYVVHEKKASDILSLSPWSLEWFEEHALEAYWRRLFES